MVPCATGSQTVGSILRPAAFCGVVGLKGPHGLVPVDGAVPLAWSLDHIGPFARSVADAALVLSVMADVKLEPADVAAPRLAVGRQLFERADPDLRHHLEGVVERLAQAGARVTELTLPPQYADIHAAGTIVLEVEAATYHQPAFARHAADYGSGMREMLQIGLQRPATEYVTANRARLAFREAMIPLLEAHDALLSPTAPGPAPAGLGWTGDASLCAPWSSAGVPSISLPTGLNASGLPLALQLIQAPGGLSRLLGVAAWCEPVLGFSERPRD
jgi:amidase